MRPNVQCSYSSSSGVPCGQSIIIYYALSVGEPLRVSSRLSKGKTCIGDAYKCVACAVSFGLVAVVGNYVRDAARTVWLDGMVHIRTARE